MASSSFSFAAAPTPGIAVTEEQFKLFHNIDRILFTRLVHNLRHNPAKSIQVIAFWIWLEHSGKCRQLVKHMLTWPDTLIAALADEAVLLLTYIESEEVPLENIDVPLTQSMTQSKGSLKFFHENRLNILHGVTRTVNEVCIRAFGDILLQHAMEREMISDGNTENLLGENEIMKELISHYGRITTSPGIMSQKPSQYFQGFDPYGPIFQGNPDVLSNEIGEIVSQLRISNSNNSEQEMEFVPADERTIFLTFSKGYPISENEIRDFFSRYVQIKICNFIFVLSASFYCIN